MPNYQKHIVYLSEEQREELFTNGSITVNGTTIEYSDNDMYVTPQEVPYVKPATGIPASDLADNVVPVQDVQVNGTSVVTDGVANVPIASQSVLGTVKGMGIRGIGVDENGNIYTVGAGNSDIKAGADSYKSIVTHNQHRAAFYGLAKAAGHDEASSTESFGVYTPGAKAAIQNMLGVTDLISTEEVSTATAAHALNSLFLMGGKLYKATSAIAIGDAVVGGTNCEVVKADEVFPHDVQVNGTSIMSDGVANIPIASTTNFGAVKIAYIQGINVDTVSKTLCIYAAGENQLKAGTNIYMPIVPNSQHKSVFYGLSKVAGVDLANETVTLGIYPETSKTAIRSLIGAAAASDVTVSDVQVNGTSVLSNGIANVPVATNESLGVIKPASGGGLYLWENGLISITPASESDIKAGTNAYTPLTPKRQHQAAFYGLAKAAGADEKDSTLSVGTYTETAKSAIRTMLGAASTNIVAVQDEQPTDTDTKVWLPETQAAGVQVPTMEDMQNYVKFTDYATDNKAGVVKVMPALGLMISNGFLTLSTASSEQIKGGNEPLKLVPTRDQHQAVFYGLAKAAGADLKDESNITVGTYPATAAAAIRAMLGVPSIDDVNTLIANKLASTTETQEIINAWEVSS